MLFQGSQTVHTSQCNQESLWGLQGQQIQKRRLPGGVSLGPGCKAELRTDQGVCPAMPARKQRPLPALVVLGPSALQADSLPSEPPGKPISELGYQHNTEVRRVCSSRGEVNCLLKSEVLPYSPSLCSFPTMILPIPPTVGCPTSGEKVPSSQASRC